MNVLRVASGRRDVADAIVQCPMVHGPAAARRWGVAPALRLSPHIVEDALRALLHRSRRYVPIVGPPGGTAVVTIEGAEEGWNSTVPPGGHFDNRVAAADALGLVWTSALRHTRKISAPLLVCVCDRETLIDPNTLSWLREGHRAARPGITTPTTSRSITHRWSIKRLPTKLLSCRSISMSARERLRDNDDRFCARARRFTADDWSRPSLCERWTNHEVLAHLVTGLSASPRSVTGAMLRRRGSFDVTNAEMAAALAALRPPAGLLYDFERLSRQPRGLGRYFPTGLLLGDHVTHELDIVFALNQVPEVPSDTLVAVLNTQVSAPNPFVPAFRNSRGLRLHATDALWSYGERGPVVEGRAAELVSVLGNRPKALSRLHGDGVAGLEARLSLPSRTGG